MSESGPSLWFRIEGGQQPAPAAGDPGKQETRERAARESDARWALLCLRGRERVEAREREVVGPARPAVLAAAVALQGWRGRNSGCGPVDDALGLPWSFLLFLASGRDRPA